MFKSIANVRTLKQEQRQGERINFIICNIIDDDFEERAVGSAILSTASTNAIYTGAIISCYSDKNLNVAKNLIIYFQYLARLRNPLWRCSVQDLISDSLKYQELYPPYHNEVEKYLSLL